MKRSIIDPNRSYSFRDYFEMNVPIDELLAYFGYTRQSQAYSLPRVLHKITQFTPLKEQLAENMLYVDLTGEAARREVLIAPILLNLARELKIKVHIEYPLYVTHQLKGKIDYYLNQTNNLLIIEAKHDDMTRGFTQLAIELIALDQWLDSNDRPLYGIVTIGDGWRFGVLNREKKQIIQDTRLYAIPTETEELLRILIAILTDEGTAS